MSLVISDLSKSRHGTSLLNGVNLELRSGAIHVCSGAMVPAKVHC